MMQGIGREFARAWRIFMIMAAVAGVVVGGVIVYIVTRFV